MVTQILNFGLPSQINVGTVGYDRATNLRVAKELQRRMNAIPGIADAHLPQEDDAPAFMADIDRARATQLGLNAQSIANNINISLSSSEQVTPNFWTDPASGIPYYIAVQTPDRSLTVHRFNIASLDRRTSGAIWRVIGRALPLACQLAATYDWINSGTWLTTSAGIPSSDLSKLRE